MASAARRGIRGMRLRALQLIAAAVVALVFAGTVVGADSITPASSTLTLAPGASFTVNPTLHLDAAPPKADILIAIDTTGSMGTAIANAKTDAKGIVDDIHQTIPAARFAIAQFKDYGDSPVWQRVQDFTTNAGTGGCGGTPIECALNGLSAGGGGDNAEAYNTAFYQAYSDPSLSWENGASRFMVVLGDSLPHDATMSSDFSGFCPDTPLTDQGPDGVGALRTYPTLTALAAAHHTNLSFVTYNSDGPLSIDWGGGFTTFGCQSALAELTGGSAVIHDAGTETLKTQIAGLINEAAKHVDAVSFTTTPVSAPAGVDEWSPSSWVSYTIPSDEGDIPQPFGPIAAPTDLNYDLTINVPEGVAPGVYRFTSHAIADGNERASQNFTINVTDGALSSLVMTADQETVPAGIAAAPYSSIPAARLPLLTSDVGSAPAGSIPAGSIPAGSIPAGSIPAGSIPAGSIPAGSIPAGSIPAGSIGFGASTPAGSIPAGSIPAGSIALKSVLLSQIPLVGTSWADILKGSPFANQPLQSVTLDDIAHYENGPPFPHVEPNKTPWERLSALPLKNVPFVTTLWRNIPFAALMLGNASLKTLNDAGATPRNSDGTPYASWSAAITDSGGSLAGPVNPATNTVFGVAISGQLGSTPAGSIPAGSIPAGSIPAGSIPAGSIDIGATALRSVLVSDINSAPGSLADFVNCTGSFTCPTGSTLGQADAAAAINPGLTLDRLFASLPAGSIGRQTTIDQIILAMLQPGDYPWEQINVQGLQDVAGTGKNVRYHVDFDLACSAASSFAIHVRLPEGFFPVPGSSAFSFAGGAPQGTADPTLGRSGLTWPGSPCGESSSTGHVRLDFTAYAGLKIGTQTSSVDVTTSRAYLAADNQAPVLVTQNWEPSDDPGTAAPTIAQNTLVVGHVASANDVDYYRFPLGGLAPGTKVAAYLKVPGGTDLDLAVNKPSAPTIQPNPAGSIPAGSIGIEDSSPGVDNSHSALPPNTLADIPAGSIPAGSIPAGSIPAGSISANRGAVSEAAQIVTRGETGDAFIGVSGYNGASSDGNYVLRIKVTPPPVLPPCPVKTGLAPTLATPSTLPASLPAGTKALFLVNRQRLAGLYDATRMNSLLSSSALTTVATQVGGAVVPVDGSAAVRSAYAAWDASPCSPEAANNVVRAINGVVAGYRASLPSLKYVVLLGTDQALPMYRQPDLTALSPEIDNAQELAFTTNGLTQGNSTYASSALNTVLTDGAYGAFSRTTLLGQDLPLPQVSVSRLVETPEDILGQFKQFVTSSGLLNIHSALTTGDDFFVDGAQATNAALGLQFSLSSSDILTSGWTRQTLLDQFFAKPGGVPDVGALYAHYNHWLAQPASLGSPVTLDSFATTADVGARSQLLFTIGCHGGFNVPDTIGGPVSADNKMRQLDWAQAYGRLQTTLTTPVPSAPAAVYVANTGFGYGDTKTVDLSEKLMGQFAKNLNTYGTIGEQWVRALHSYYRQAGAYDVVDLKVMAEATMYGLPFYGYGTPGTPPAGPPAPTTHVDGGLDTATLPVITPNISGHGGPGPQLFYDTAHPDGATYTDTNGVDLTPGTLSTIYRPVQPLVTRDVTVPGKAAHGAFITSLTTHTESGVIPVKGRPLVDSQAHEPPLNFPNIFFPAGLVTVNRDVAFGVERSTAVVNLGRFRPDDTGDAGVEQVVDSIGLDIGYSNSTDNLAPQITQTGAIETAPQNFTAFVRVTDDSGSLHRVAVLYNTGGSPTWSIKELTNAGGDLWTGTITTTSPGQIVLDAEAQDNAGNVGFSFNKAVNFQSVPDPGTGPTISVDQPLPGSVFKLHQLVRTNFDCSDIGGVANCRGGTDGGPSFRSGALLDTLFPGQHTFTVTGTDLAGHTVSKSVNFTVFFVFSGFKPPVDNPPTVNVEEAGRTIPVKWALNDIFGIKWPFRSAVQSISSKAIKCPTAASDPIENEVPVGLSGLKIEDGEFQFNWSTQKSWKATCRRLFVHFSDGTTPFAEFRFK